MSKKNKSQYRFFLFSSFSTQICRILSEKDLMKSEFERIFRETLAKNTQGVAETPLSSLGETDPSHLAFLLGKIEKTTFTTQKNKTYFQDLSPKSETKTLSQLVLPTPPTPPAHLSIRQKEGWLWFWKKGAGLNENYTKTELQKQFRRLARALHPDQNPHPRAAETFIQLREHYDNLALG